ncbi:MULTISPECIES: Sec-independent protein translocase TatB [unclassified Microbacterium]|uniref:Sec-independent protein translocase TatB n=1 Tax=unclassified Microbacterium TaxID=2609290 RepID=UPI001AC889E3|nr:MULTISPECIES: Sec-independent protein translocase TatB [unclassified Microbacterium]MBN9157713.1 Sec-independent protein translocase TatB [Microbacterium sp.]MBS1901539.1 Sec-independent protein translocase TatB [Actinomycetota bacterium]
MFFGITIEKLLVIGVIAALLVGPERLPRYAESFARLVKRAGDYLRGAKDRMREEVGPEIDELDWRKLDPRQYDPRRIIRDALMDDSPAPARPAAPAVAAETPAAAAPAAGSAAALLASATAMNAASASAEPAPDAPASRAPKVFSAEELPPYDSEAT